jgi:hypothetical protein
MVLVGSASAQSLAVHLGMPTYQESFSSGAVSGNVLITGDSNRWDISSYSSANYAGCGSATSFQAANVRLSGGMLQEVLTQPTSTTANSAEITSETLFGYGTFEFYARFGSTSSTPLGAGTSVSGGVSSPFLINNSGQQGPGYTEIDVPEIEGLPARAANINYAVYRDTGHTVPSGGNFTSGFVRLPGGALPHTGFHYYGMIWSAGVVDIYLDGIYQGSDTSGVPVNPAVIDINHYGCNSTGWGGLATPGSTRYFYVASVKVWDGTLLPRSPGIAGTWR